jgi:pimeloyl-ACP methyl ester carboxylesterase
MEGELVRVTTSDGLELQGLLVTPASGPAKTTVIHVHGLSGNFYENRFVDHAADAATGAGANFITINNRGHEYISDFICESPEGVTSKQIGGAFETFGDCLKDIQAWVDLAKSRGAERIVLQGHSHGALKVTYYLSKTDDPVIAGIVLLSPSDDFGLQRYRMGRRFDEILGIVKKMVDEGRGHDFIPRDYFHYHISAATYYDTFRPDSPLKLFNISMTETHHFPALEHIKIPLLLIVGSVDEAFIGRADEFVADVRRKIKKTKDFSGQVLSEAPHNYLGHESELAGHIGEWLKAHFGG